MVEIVMQKAPGPVQLFGFYSVAPGVFAPTLFLSRWQSLGEGVQEGSLPSSTSELEWFRETLRRRRMIDDNCSESSRVAGPL